MSLKTSDFDYSLDVSLIAQQPLARRDQSRLMVLRRRGDAVSHHVFAELPSLLEAGDLLVANDTRVIPAKFLARRSSGGRIEGLFVREIALGRWEVLLKGAGRCRAGEALALQATAAISLAAAPEAAGTCGVSLILAEAGGEGRWVVDVQPALPAVEVLESAGATPLPPYIRRRRAADDVADRGSYQTVYAARPGAVAAPTAGLHFTPQLMERLAGAGIQLASVTLHVGLGTFTPVKCEDPSEHKMHSEWFELSADAAEKVNSARRQGRRVVAVGTTSVRVLEAAARGSAPAQVQPQSGWTDIFIRPPADFLAVDGLITNFHLPRSTLLMLAAAFCSPGRSEGVATILGAYQEAMRLRYRFYSYGDAMLIL